MMAVCETQVGAVSEAFCSDYFSSLGQLSRRILVEQDVIRSLHEWSEVSNEEKDKLVNNYFIDTDIEKKFTVKTDKTIFDEDEDQSEKLPEVYFPRYKIKSGEKIVVDFENGCWTWEDEHSGPFSWECKAQRECNPFEADTKSFRKSKTPRERLPSTSEDKVFAFNPNKSIWDSPFLKADNMESSGFGEIFQDLNGEISLSPSRARCVSPDVDDQFTFNLKEVEESNRELEEFCTRQKPEIKPSPTPESDDEHNSRSLSTYVNLPNEQPHEAPVIKLKTPFSFKKSRPAPPPPDAEIYVPRKPAPPPPVTNEPPYASTNFKKNITKPQVPPKIDVEPVENYGFPIYEPEPVPQPRVYRKQAPTAPYAKPRQVVEECSDIYEPVTIGGGQMALPYEIVDIEQVTIENMPLPPEDNDDIDNGNEYYQTFEEAQALSKQIALGTSSCTAVEDLPMPDFSSFDADDVITEQPDFVDVGEMLDNENTAARNSMTNSMMMKTGFSFLDDW